MPSDWLNHLTRSSGHELDVDAAALQLRLQHLRELGIDRAHGVLHLVLLRVVEARRVEKLLRLGDVVPEVLHESGSSSGSA